MVERQLEAAAQANGISNDEAARRFLAEKQPMAKFTTPESIGAMAVFLCSDAAATIAQVRRAEHRAVQPRVNQHHAVRERLRGVRGEEKRHAEAS